MNGGRFVAHRPHLLRAEPGSSAALTARVANHQMTMLAQVLQRELAAEDRTRAVLGFDRFDALVALLESARDALLKDAAAG